MSLRTLCLPPGFAESTRAGQGDFDQSCLQTLLLLHFVRPYKCVWVCVACVCAHVTAGKGTVIQITTSCPDQGARCARAALLRLINVMSPGMDVAAWIRITICLSCLLRLFSPTTSAQGKSWSNMVVAFISDKHLTVSTYLWIL